MRLYTRILLALCGISSISNTSVSDPPKNPESHASFDNALMEALEKQQQMERSDAENTGQQRNVNKNQGLINTIVNHNNQIKTFENKFNHIVNNYANSSHVKEVKEVIERTKEIEKHVFGAPRPHKSWREFVLVFICCVFLVIIAARIGTQWLMPKFINYVSKATQDKAVVMSTISARVSEDKVKIEEVVKQLQQTTSENSKHYHEIMQMIREMNTSPKM